MFASLLTAVGVKFRRVANDHAVGLEAKGLASRLDPDGAADHRVGGGRVRVRDRDLSLRAWRAAEDLLEDGHGERFP